MTQPIYSRVLFSILFAFAATAVASIACQNIFIWSAVAFFLSFQFKNKEPFDWPRGPFPLATLLFLLTFLIGALVGINPDNSFNTVHKYLTLFLLFLVGAMPLAFKKIKTLLLTLNYGAAFCAIHGIWKHFWLHQDRIDSFSGDKMVFGGMLMVCLLIQGYFLKNEPRYWLHWFFFGILGFGLLLTETRGAWLGFGFGFAILGWKFNRKWLLSGLAAAILLFFLLPANFQERVKSIWTINISFSNGTVQSSNYHERPYIWLAGWNIIKDHPFGIGQGNLGELYPKYKLPAATEPNVPHLHNNFLQITAQNGWLGLTSYLLWIVAFFITAFRWKTENPEGQDLNWTFLCVFSGILVWGLTEYTFSHQFMNLQFFLLGLLASLWKNNNEKSVG